MSAELESWQPVRLSADAATRAIGTSTGVCDALPGQLRELMEVRHAGEILSDERLATLITAHLAGTPAPAYGQWFYYPWLDRAVHVLPEDEFNEVRLSRNRNKITLQEQNHLSRLRVGIAGLSVGQATAVTLAMEGIGGQFALADFDTLSLSNMNRLRAGIHDLGLNKAVMTARQMYEINPYLRIRLFPRGVDDGSLDGFLEGDGALDLLIEECDDIYMKLRLREEARRLRIPVLMETSDRGMIDVERFDVEPDRPLFHGRIDTLCARELQGLRSEQKLAVAMTIVGADTVSPRLAASALEIGATLRTWPQLASAIALGAGINVDTARRIALGEPLRSGRYYVDLDRLIGAVDETPIPSGEPMNPPTPRRGPVADADTKTPIETIVRSAAAAPSGGNAQPWRFRWNGERLRLLVDPSRTGGLLDYRRRATHLALGAATENLVLSATAQGFGIRLSLFPEKAAPDAVCDVDLITTGTPIPVDPLHREIFRRATNRRLGERRALPPAQGQALAAAVAAQGARLLLIDDDTRMTGLAQILGQGDRLRFLSRALHGELMSELRWTAQDAQATGDGIDIRTLELSPMDLAALRLTANWRVMEMVGKCGGGRNLERFAHAAARGSSAFGILVAGGTTPRDCFAGGRAMQRLWLTASALGLGLQPMAALPYLFMRAVDGGDGLTPDETRTLLQLRARYRELLGLHQDEHDLLLFRLAQVEAPSERALRRPLDTVLEILEEAY